MTTREEERLGESRDRTAHWKRWGPYLSERAWGTVREDYSPGGTAWDYVPHDHARSRAYRWNEDGIAGISDRRQNMCFALAMWNEKDPILKERLFGLTGSEGNHGEDVKEYYFYLDNTPTHSYMKYLYKYPKDAFHRYLIEGEEGAVNPALTGTKAALHYRLTVPANSEVVVKLRLAKGSGAASTANDFGAEFDELFATRKEEADEFYAAVMPKHIDNDSANIMRQAFAGLLWSKQFYHFVVKQWTDGDDASAPPPD